MDILAHALYGATCCSRTGLAGGRRGAGLIRRSFSRDWTVWVAAGFGILPDLSSIGIYFAQMMIRGAPPSFHGIPPYVYTLYHSTHSLISAVLLVLVLYTIARPLARPALAWPLHIVMDSLSHGNGRWQTLMLYPLSDWHFHGVNWWQHPVVMLLYWGVLPVLWTGLHIWRRRRKPDLESVGPGRRFQA
ncbi:MAG: hypothetical protein WCS01_07305 [bacterium]